MKGLVALAALLFMTTAAQSEDPTVEKGKAVYETATPKCKTCHSVGGVGNAKGALEGAASKLKPQEVRGWLRTPQGDDGEDEGDAQAPDAAYGPDKISDADLDALTAYLLSLK
jgi:mono/diheme cytochrome c family protein